MTIRRPALPTGRPFLTIREAMSFPLDKKAKALNKDHMGGANIENKGLRHGFGLLGALLQIGLSFSEYVEGGLDALVAIYLAFCLVFIACALFSCLGSLQVVLFLALSAITTTFHLNCYLGLSFSIVAALIFFRLGGFLHSSALKAAILGTVGSLAFVLPIVLSRQPTLTHASALIAAFIYLFLVTALARARVLSAFGPRKPVLRLKDFRLNKRETEMVKGRISGKTTKQLAIEYRISISTVRNNLALASHKLNLQDREAFGALGERYRIE